MLHFLPFPVDTEWFFCQYSVLCTCRKLDAVEEIIMKNKIKDTLLCMVNQPALESG